MPVSLNDSMRTYYAPEVAVLFVNNISWDILVVLIHIFEVRVLGLKSCVLVKLPFQLR